MIGKPARRLERAAGAIRSGGATTTAALSRRIPARCVVPMVRGLPVADATKALGNVGCRARTRRTSGIGVLPGLVLGTSPREGTRRPNGATIVLRVRR